MFPGIVFCIFFVLNALIWGEKSSGVVPFGTMFALVFLWFGISMPLVFIGSYFGYKKPAIEDPVKTSKIPRQIPEQAWYMQPVFSVLIGGILSFGVVFIELFFILTSIWLNQFYYIFGFLFIVFVILLVTCAEITIVLCYFQLCSEDYHWWWRAYLTSGSSTLYLFLYAIFYFFTKLETLVCLIVILPRSNSLQVVRVPNYPSIVVSELIGSVVVQRTLANGQQRPDLQCCTLGRHKLLEHSWWPALQVYES
jgi:transmembrane 9 superfamily protein 2/4